MLPEARGLLNQTWGSGAVLLQACLLISEMAANRGGRGNAARPRWLPGPRGLFWETRSPLLTPASQKLIMAVSEVAEGR